MQPETTVTVEDGKVVSTMTMDKSEYIKQQQSILNQLSLQQSQITSQIKTVIANLQSATK